MGRAFGEACRDQIGGLYAARVQNAITQAESYGGRTITEADVRQIARRSLPIVRDWAPRGIEELEGVAEGANLDIEQIWAMNALTDLRDVAAWGDPALWEAEGCSSFVVAPDVAKDGRSLCGQTWDLAADNMPYVLLVSRKPEGKPATRALTTVGCLSLIGMNEDGVAIGTTNIRTLDARLGVCYLDVIHAVLEETTLDGAVSRIRSAPRAGAHYFYVMDRKGLGAAVECSAQHAHVQSIDSGVYVHCNHTLMQPNAELEVKGTPTASTHHRQARMAELFDARDITPEDTFSHMSDLEGGANAICRRDYEGITSNAAVVMSPTDGTMWAVHGPPCEGTFAVVDG